MRKPVAYIIDREGQRIGEIKKTWYGTSERFYGAPYYPYSNSINFRLVTIDYKSLHEVSAYFLKYRGITIKAAV